MAETHLDVAVDAERKLSSLSMVCVQSVENISDDGPSTTLRSQQESHFNLIMILTIGPKVIVPA